MIKALKWLAIVAVLLLVLALLAVVEWVAYAGHARLGREVRTPEQLDGGQGRFIDAAGAHIHLREWGAASAPTLLLIHGTGGWSGAWFASPATLSAAGWHVVAMDLPPFGLSTLRPDDASIRVTPGGAASGAASGPGISFDTTRKAQAARILAVIDSLGAPVTLIAHSFGSGPSLEAALHAGGRLRQLVLVDPALGLGPNGEEPVCEEPGPELSSLLASRPVRTAIISSAIAWPGFATSMLRGFVYRKDAMTPPTVAAYEVPFERIGFAAQLGDYVAGFVRGNCETADSLSLAKVAAWSAGEKTPVALLWGREDSITPIGQAAALQRVIPGATLTVIPCVGHIPHVESPTEFSAALLGVLQR